MWIHYLIINHYYNFIEGVTGMTRNHFICNMVEVLSIQDQNKCIPCSHCEQPTVGRCVTCELFMCEKCLQSHNGYIGFRDHVVLTMEELSKPENQSKIKGKSFCKKHPRISDHKAGQRKAYDIAQALIENGSNEEIMLSHKSVQQSVEKSEKGYERKEIDDEVPQYSDGQLDRMFYDEIKASKKGKGGYIFTSFVNTLTKYCRTDKPRPLMPHLN